MASKTLTAAKRTVKTRAEALKEAAQQQGRARTESVNQKVRSAMRAIEADIQGNDGVYPSNGGALSLNELARRAEIHFTTLHGEKYTSLLTEAKEWLVSVKAGHVTGRLRVRKALATRVSEWKDLYERCRQVERDTQLSLQQKDAELERAQDEILVLHREVERLRALVAALDPNVIPLRKPNKEK